jgi:hypothetical protein
MAAKLMATHVDIGPTFEKNTFGSCKKMNNNPCQAVVTQWSGYYEKITLQDNNGKLCWKTVKPLVLSEARIVLRSLITDRPLKLLLRM